MELVVFGYSTALQLDFTYYSPWPYRYNNDRSFIAQRVPRLARAARVWAAQQPEDTSHKLRPLNAQAGGEYGGGFPASRPEPP